MVLKKISKGMKFQYNYYSCFQWQLLITIYNYYIITDLDPANKDKKAKTGEKDRFEALALCYANRSEHFAFLQHTKSVPVNYLGTISIK